MNSFSYTQAPNPEAASARLSSDNHARIIAGGTDLLPQIKDGLVEPTTLVDLSKWADGKRLEQTESGLRIGATATLSEIAASTLVRGSYAALADACSVSASPQLRNMGTIGGNLLQDTRCWYYRGPLDCWLKGGKECLARDGQNEQHAIFSTSPTESICVSAHPSDPAAALLALNAKVEYVSENAVRTIPIEDMFALPTSEHRSVTTLPRASVITAVILPASNSGQRSIYRKAMARGTWAFAIVGLALRLDVSNGGVTDATLAMSGVAPVPMRSPAVENLLRGSSLDELDHDRLAEALTAGARPLEMNSYKLDVAAGLLKQTLEEIRDRGNSR